MRFEVAAVLSALGNTIEELGLNVHQLRTLRAIKECRTASLGGHVDACSSCGIVKISYNSCRNRHCPKCQGHKKELWIQQRSQQLLPVPYFHVVFTLPSELNPLALHQPKIVYGALFDATWQTFQTFGSKHNLQMGMFCILHTWGQNLSLHPHLHCIIPGGGVNRQGKFIPIRADSKFLFSVKAMSKVFRAKYVALLRQKGIEDKPLYDSLFAKPWIVFAKRPFGNVHSVVEYLGRYTHKIAISNNRITSVDNNEVSFTYKDYKSNGQRKTIRLSNTEFVRRFAQHILPLRFVRIRHYGFLSSTAKRGKLAVLQQQLKAVVPIIKEQTKLRCCSHCKTPTMITIEVFGKRGPPKKYLWATPINPA